MIWIIVAVVVIIAAAAGIWYWYMKKVTIDVTNQSLTVKVGATTTCTINNYSSLKNPSVSSSDTDVLTVVLATTGLVTMTGVKVGTATVSIKGSNAKTTELDMTVTAT